MIDNITAWSDYDSSNTWCLYISKNKGKLTLDEIKAVASDWNMNSYLLQIDCFDSKIEQYDEFDENGNDKGDLVILYKTNDILKRE